MARWQADTEVRLKLAAIELFGTHGFEAVTVSDIAAAVGVIFTQYAFLAQHLYDALVGLIADATSLRWGLLVMPAAGVIVLLLAGVLARRVPHGAAVHDPRA